MYTVFLTGGIGSGKSTVASLMRARGARVIDTDALAHDVLLDPQAMIELAERFGEDVLAYADGCTLCEGQDPSEIERLCCAGEVRVDRARLAERAFATPEATSALNGITHPRIFERLGDLLTPSPCTGTGEDGVVVVEIPLIEASGTEALALADEIVAVACPRELRRLRVQGRGMAPDDFDERDARQLTDEGRAELADAVIVNDGDAEALEQAVDGWWRARAACGWRPRGQRRRPAGVGTGAPAPGGCSLRVPGLASPAVAFVGRHNSGKTTLVVKVIAALAARGVDVGSVKHHGHVGFEVDVPGKDSWRHREAGANEVAVCSPDRLALIRELDEPLEAAEVINLMRPHDVVVVEGYRHSGVPTVEVMRSGNERDRAAAAEFVRATAAGERFAFDPAALGADADRMPDGLTLGVASDMPDVRAAARACGLEAFDLDDPAPIADYIVRALGV